MPLSKIDEAGLASNAQYTGFKNRIINGAMAIAQRGTSFTSVGNSGSVPAYTLDRWFGWRGAWTANLDVSQQTGWGSYQYAMRVQRTSGTSSTASINIAQIIESINCYDLAGQNVTISLGMRSGANYSGGQVSVIAQFSTAANQTSSGLGNGTWTGQTGLSQNFTITTTATSYSLTVAVPSNALSVALQINWTPTGIAGTNDYIEITGVQLEKGSTATSFDYRPYGTELQLCQRYFEKIGGTTAADIYYVGGGTSGHNFSTTIGMVYKRVAPIVTVVGTWTVVTCNQPSVRSTSEQCITFGSSWTGTTGAGSFASTTSAYLTASAEL